MLELSNVLLFTAVVGLQMSGFEPSLLCSCVCFFAFSVLFFGWVRGVKYCCRCFVLFFTPYPKYTWFWLFKLPKVWRTFWGGKLTKSGIPGWFLNKIGHLFFRDGARLRTYAKRLQNTRSGA